MFKRDSAVITVKLKLHINTRWFACNKKETHFKFQYKPNITLPTTLVRRAVGVRLFTFMFMRR